MFPVELRVPETSSTKDIATAWTRSVTFQTAPNLFTQLVTIHGLFDDGWRMPLAYGLLPGKTQHHYEALLAEIVSVGVEPMESVMSVKMMYHILINSTSPSESCSAIDATNFTKLISTENETLKFITSEGQAACHQNLSEIFYQKILLPP